MVLLDIGSKAEVASSARINWGSTANPPGQTEALLLSDRHPTCRSMQTIFHLFP